MLVVGGGALADPESGPVLVGQATLLPSAGHMETPISTLPSTGRTCEIHLSFVCSILAS